ncbi:hypothetical protein ZWY2020_039975 [Hordeum vulgare]|nr:hypothetical protein ZWY2020_039975 [Hordeum vulgare]
MGSLDTERRLLTVAVHKVKLILTPKKEDGLKAMAVPDNTDYTQTTDSTTNVITVNFGTLFGGESRKVTIKMMPLDCPFGRTRHNSGRNKQPTVGGYVQQLHDKSI